MSHRPPNPADMTPEEDAPSVLPSGPVMDVRPRAMPPMLQRPIGYRAIFWLALPTLTEQIISGAIGLTDTLVAGHGKAAENNTAAAAAVGSMGYLMWLASLIGSLLGVGATAIVARSFGARRVRVAQRVAGTALTASAVLGVLVALGLFLFAEQVVSLFRLQGQAGRYAVEYLHIMSITVCLQTLGQIGLACVRGSGDLVRPMAISASVALINVVTCPALAYGWLGLPALGIRGNALGTMIAFVISGTATLLLLLRGGAPLRLQLRHLRIVPHVLWRILRVSLPSGVEGILLWGGQVLVVNVVSAVNDAQWAELRGVKLEQVSGVTLAGHNAVLRIEGLAFLPGFGLGIATSVLVGQCLGAGRPDEARRATWIAAKLAVLAMTLAAAPMVIFPALLTQLMVNSADVQRIAVWPMIFAGLAQPGFALAIIMAAALRGAGDTLTVMVSTLTGIFVVRVPLVLAGMYLCAKLGLPGWGLTVVWVVIFLDLQYRAVFNTVAFLRGKWARIMV